jgi:DNA replication protein DnaC
MKRQAWKQQNRDLLLKRRKEEYLRHYHAGRRHSRYLETLPEILELMRQRWKARSYYQKERRRVAHRKRYSIDGSEKRQAKYVRLEEAATASIRRSQNPRKLRAAVVLRSIYIPGAADGNLSGPASWTSCAQTMIQHEGHWGLTGQDVSPPAMAAIHDASSLQIIDEMHSFLADFTWATCVSCWKAWYCVNESFHFSAAALVGPAGTKMTTPWFKLQTSEILAQCVWQGKFCVPTDLADAFISRNPALVECTCGCTGALCGSGSECITCGKEAWRRRIGICCLCETEDVKAGVGRRSDAVVDPLWEEFDGKEWLSTEVPEQPRSEDVLSRYTFPPVDECGDPQKLIILGRTLADFCPALAQLTDMEEMLISLVHPLVQVYSIPRTGELAYVGHICNFRQDVKAFMRSIPMDPSKIPFVMVRPRVHRSCTDRRVRPPFKVDVTKLQAAYEWLRLHNPYYRDVLWDEDIATRWNEEPDLPTADEDIDAHIRLGRADFEAWLQCGQLALQTDDEPAFLMAKVALSVFQRAGEEKAEWFAAIDALAAEVGKDAFRRADSISTADLAFLLQTQIYPPLACPWTHADLSTASSDDWPDFVQSLVAEIATVLLSQRASEEIVEAANLDEEPANADFKDREDALHELAKAMDDQAMKGGVPCLEPEQKRSRKSEKATYPRVNAPKVFDDVSSAINETTPGYIARAFPKLFPHGVGDFHDNSHGLKKASFREWGRYCLLWHDQRFMRHTRFRYWFLNTDLRVHIPGARTVFWRQHPEYSELTLDMCKDRNVSRRMVQHMSTVTSNIPGSVGERRLMRHTLETMVDQIEMETAESGENYGQGRLPAGFCTFTVAAYKWTQLHETCLLSYCPEDREKLKEWQTCSDTKEREKLRRQVYYKVALANPGIVAWYAALRLESLVHLTAAVLSRVGQQELVPGRANAAAQLQAELAKQAGEANIQDLELFTLVDLGRVDDWWATFEWSGGGLVHVHVALWIVGSPRIDRIISKESEKGGSDPSAQETILTTEDSVQLDGESAARVMSAFWERVYTEWNPWKSTSEADEVKIGPRKAMGKDGDRCSLSPESISTESLRSMLKTSSDAVIENAVWSELAEILRGGWGDAIADSIGGVPEFSAARARHAFVAALAEWTQMHDLHDPFPQGPPAKCQACAKVDNEHSSMERVTCGKLYPRRGIVAGGAEIAEDPRRRELYRLWLSRNCSYINNYVPVLMLATLSNMDFQATTTKFGVVEYMTKYMTKSGQGSLLNVMENSFAKCLEKARAEEKGIKSAAAKFFNTAAVQEPKTQLEVMHLAFGFPRFLCSRKSRRLSTHSNAQKLPDPKDVTEKMRDTGVIISGSKTIVYLERHKFEKASSKLLCSLHPGSHRPIWQEVLMQITDLDTQQLQKLSETGEGVSAAGAHWPAYLRSLSWWQFERFFKKDRSNSLSVRDSAMIVLVTPTPRFTAAVDEVKLVVASKHALIAYCSHGPRHEWFQDLASLNSLHNDAVIRFMDIFVNANKEERKKLFLCHCPLFLKRQYGIGRLRREKIESKMLSMSDAVKSVQHFCFEEDEKGGVPRPWQEVFWENMTSDQQTHATEEWLRADHKEMELLENQEKCGSELNAAGVVRLRRYMSETMKWKSADLHDACLHLGCSVGSQISLVRYFLALWESVRDAKTSFQPQSQRSHTVANLKAALKALQRGGRQLGLQGQKKVLAERLSTCVRHIMEQATMTQDAIDAGLQADEEICGEFASADDLSYHRKNTRFPMKLLSAPYATIPENAVVDAAMAESALGHNLADDFDEELLSCDKDVRAEEEQLLQVALNPPDLDYSCLSISPSDMAAEEKLLYGLRDATKMESQQLFDQLQTAKFTASHFATTDTKAKDILATSSQEQQRLFKEDAFTDKSQRIHAEEIAALDPTQRMVYDVVKQWSEKEQALPGRDEPLRLVVLGTAGTGKTFTTKSAVAAARLAFGDFEAVAMVAHTGVAAANMGCGATTIDKFFSLGGDKAEEDLTDSALDTLVEHLRNVRLLVIDEISTVGAAQFEMIHRRLQQVHLYLCQMQSEGRHAQVDYGFGNIGLMLVGDFGQLPPVCASSLIGTTPSEHGGSRGHAAKGQRRFQSMTTVIRLRRIYRQAKADEFKESTIRLRDCVSRPSDYEMWKTHELTGDLVTPKWDGSSKLLEQALTLVVENEACGAINGKKLRAMSVHTHVVRAMATHTDERGPQRPADEFRQVRSLTHLCVGAPVMLTQNYIWGESVVNLGLMNGARGRVVAILYKTPTERRTDGLPASTGYPNGLKACPLPDLVIVHFPGYVGRRFFQGLPSTWVPIPCVEIRHERRKSSIRIGLPLRLSWAMTVHKSQGITAKEGIVIDFHVGKNRNPVASAGLAFVAFTRAEKFERVAFRNLPPFQHFLAPRNSKEFHNRVVYEKSAAEFAEAFTFKFRGWTLQEEYDEHIAWSSARAGADLDQLVRKDIRDALFSKGVVPMDPDVLQWLQEEAQLGRTATMADIARAFRGHRPKQKEGLMKKLIQEPERKKSKKKTETSDKPSTPRTACVADPLLFMLCELGFQEQLAKHALVICGREDVSHVFDFCEAHAQEDIQDWDVHMTQLTQQLSLYNQRVSILKRAGFDISCFHESKDGSHLPILGDAGPAGLRRMQSLAKRRLSKQSPMLLNIPARLHSEYQTRASSEWGGNEWRVHDFGQAAGRHANSCFWLSVIAGWSRLRGYFDGNMDWMPGNLKALVLRVQKLAEVDLQFLAACRPVNGTDELGWCAHELRTLMTAGDNSVMLQDYMRWYPAYACLQSSGLGQREPTLQHFKSWLQKVSLSDFADELVLAATSQYLRIIIATVPHTPADASHLWAVSEHPCQEVAAQQHIDPRHRIAVGNNDVHYVLLSQM